MTISSEQVAHIAKLARLKIDAAEAEQYAAQLSRILEVVGEMAQVDTTAITASEAWLPHLEQGPLREDAITNSDRRDEFQAVAPVVGGGLYLVPRVIE